MSEITVALDRGINGSALQRLRATLPRVGPGDQLTITLERFDAHHADSIFALLDEYGFDYQPKGGKDPVYCIVATRGKPGARIH